MKREREFSLFGAGKKLLSLVVKDTVGKSIDQTVRPKPKPESKTDIPPEFMDSYHAVEAFLMAKLAINNNSKTGESPFNQGEMGGSDNAQNSLEELGTRFSDAYIARYFVHSRASKEYQSDPQALADVMSALSSIRAANK